MELFLSTNTGLFTEVKTLVTNEAVAQHQDQVDLQAGLAELMTLQAQLAENTGRLFDYQKQTMYVNERIVEAQHQAMKNTEQLAKVLDPDNHSVGDQPTTSTMPSTTI
jgi:hypothetical protein